MACCPRPSRPRLLLFTLLLCALAIVPAWGRISLRLRGGIHALLAGQDAKRLYSAPVQVNGIDGQLTAYGLDLTPAGAARVIADAPTEHAHSIIVPTAVPDRTVVMVIDAPQRPAAASPARQQWPTDAIPEYPQSELRFSAVDLANRTTLCISTTLDGAATVLATLDRDLRALNWSRNPVGGRTAVYTRKEAICIVDVHENDSRTRITLLHKQPVSP